MLVDVVESLSERDEGGVIVADDAGIERALRSFSAALDSQDSLFQCDAVNPRITGDVLCDADFVLRFRRSELSANRGLHLAMVQKLVELLRGAGSAETLASRICLMKVAGGTALRFRLEARGTGGEQARLRWGLGVAHVQQALLFTSRYLRQQMGQNGE
jgi:hypothetical protein